MSGLRQVLIAHGMDTLLDEANLVGGNERRPCHRRRDHGCAIWRAALRSWRRAQLRIDVPQSRSGGRATRRVVLSQAYRRSKQGLDRPRGRVLSGPKMHERHPVKAELVFIGIRTEPLKQPDLGVVVGRTFSSLDSGECREADSNDP